MRAVAARSQVESAERRQCHQHIAVCSVLQLEGTSEVAQFLQAQTRSGTSRSRSPTFFGISSTLSCDMRRSCFH